MTSIQPTPYSEPIVTPNAADWYEYQSTIRGLADYYQGTDPWTGETLLATLIDGVSQLQHNWETNFWYRLEEARNHWQNVQEISDALVAFKAACHTFESKLGELEDSYRQVVDAFTSLGGQLPEPSSSASTESQATPAGDTEADDGGVS